MPDRIRQVLNVLFAVTQVAVPVIGWRHGGDIGSVADEYPTWLTPAGYAFSIWTPIFALCLAYALAQALPARTTDRLYRAVGAWTAAALLGTTLWQILFPLRWFVGANLVMFGILGALVMVHRRLSREREVEPHRAGWERIALRLGFGLFFGWIVVAAVADTAQTAAALGWTEAGVPPVPWGMLVVLVVAGVAAWGAVRMGGNVGFALAVVWGLAGIAVARLRGADGLASAPLAWVALAGVAVVVAGWIMGMRRRAA